MKILFFLQFFLVYDKKNYTFAEINSGCGADWLARACKGCNELEIQVLFPRKVLHDA